MGVAPAPPLRPEPEPPAPPEVALPEAGRQEGRLGKVFRATEELNRRAVLAALEPRPGCALLDIGPHRGEFTARVAERLRAGSVAGVELIADHIPEARARGIDVVQADVDADGLPFAEASFDVVHANQVIEHVRRTDRFMSEIRRVLVPGGVAVVSTNNIASWHNIFSLVLGYQPMPQHVSDEVILGNPLNPLHGDLHEDLGRSHLRLFTARALAELAAHHGLEPVEVGASGYYPLTGAPARLAARRDPRHAAFLVAVLRRPDGL